MKENIQPEDNTSYGSQVFSPLREQGGFGGLGVFTPTSTTPMMMSVNNSRLSTESVFSPLRETSSNTFSPAASIAGAGKKLSMTPVTSFERRTSILTSIREEAGNASASVASFNENQRSFSPPNQDSYTEKAASVLRPENSVSTSSEAMEPVVISASVPFYLPKEATELTSSEVTTTKTTTGNSKKVSLYSLFAPFFMKNIFKKSKTNYT
jgi:hypothetical protein